MFACLIACGCASSDKFDKNSPEGAFAYAERLLKQYRYEESIQQFQSVRNQFPYSRLATDAELRIADIQFDREAYGEAQAAYQLFKDLHPKHPKVAYVTLRLALSYFNELPSTMDRDLTLAEKAILYFDELIRVHPDSEFVAEAREKRAKCRRMLGDKEIYIADFYFKRKEYDSALGRFEGLLKKFPDVGLNAKALRGAALSSWRANDRTKALAFLAQLRTQFKDSVELQEVQGEVRP
jgi:outer membrane protein assembly factor BamD